ncbi:endonuclease/exonuclease/phosphatase family protein [Sphaerisporangium sp. NPDC051011]|uniref:OmpL47-type beta-barrel domain-containing protein n=1 Tax=Sphaerisporangium sp. NPDC051011 TaxID=3155792 RepID=UPI003406BCAF
MRSLQRGIGRRIAAVIVAALVAAPLSGAVAQADTVTEYLQNPSFEQPGANAAAPTGWTPVLIGNETAPYRWVVQTFNASGQYPPPSPIPDGQFGLEMFWQVGSNLGVMGIAAQQNVNVPSANDLYFSYDAAQTFYPDSRSANWAGAMAEVQFTSGGQANSLRYFHPMSRTDYTGSPQDSATTKYIIGERFTGNGDWVANSRDLDADIRTKFGITDFTVTSVRVGNLQDRKAVSPLPNMTTYWDDVELTKGGVNEGPGNPDPTTPDCTKINGIQGSGPVSPCVGRTVTVQGVVTGIDDEVGADYNRTYPEDRGIFLQSLPSDDDNNPATSEGVFVGYVDTASSFRPGDVVRVTGQVKEKFGLTEIAEQIGQEPTKLGTAAVPAPVVIDQARAESQGADRAYYESLENMLVKLPVGTANSGGTNKFGELFLTPGTTRDRILEGEPLPVSLLALDADAGAGNPANPHKPPAPSTTYVTADLFDQVRDATGPLSFSFSNYKLMPQPGALPSVVDGPVAYPYTGVPQATPGQVRVVSFNVLNYFPVGVELDLSPVGQAEYDEKKARLADAIDRLLKRPDIVAVQEVYNLAVLRDLAATLGGYTAYLLEGNDSRGIDVGYLVKDGVQVANLRQFDRTTPGCDDSGLAYDRPPLALDVKVYGREFTIVNNHFKSKGGAGASGACQLQQANRLRGQVASLEAAGRQVIVLGDLNQFETETPLAALQTGTSLTNLWGSAPAEFRYSSQYQGVLQTLDHVLVTDGLDSAVADFRYAPINTDYADRFTGGGAGADGHKVADHNPAVLTLSLDGVAPVTSATIDPAQPTSGWFTSALLVTLSATDQGSGVDRTEYQLDGGAWTGYTEPVVVAGDGPHTLAYRSVDKTGNVEETKTLAVKVDATAPVTTASFPPGNGGWHNGGVPVTLSATDAGSGVAGTEYALDGGAWTPYTATVTVSGAGEHELRYRSTDKAGNVEESKAVTVKIDTGSPTVVISGIADGTTYGDSLDLPIGWQVVDTRSGVKTVTGTLDGQPFQPGTLKLHEPALGEHTLTVTAVNNAGNQTVQTVKFTIGTSTNDISALIDRFEKVGKLTAHGAAKLQDRISKVMVSEDKDRERDKKKIVKKLEKFVDAVNDPKNVSDDQVKALLLRDANALIAENGGPSES